MVKKRIARPCLFLLAALVCLNGRPGLDPKPAMAGIADHPVINEIHVDSLAGTGGIEDDWVELFNPTGTDISLAGWSVQKTSNTGSSLNRQDLSGTIPAGGYFLIVKNDPATAQSLKDQADYLASSAFDLSANGIIHLVHSNINITTSTEASVIDYAGFGTAAAFEGSGPAPAIPEAKSISRVPDGEDKDNNAADFLVMDAPTPLNSSAQGGSPDNGISGTVLFTILPAAVPVQNIGAAAAEIVFTANAAGTALVEYGLDPAYGNLSEPVVVTENAEKRILLTNLQCGTQYHYRVYGENSTASENDQTMDASFTTLPCGIRLDNLAMTKQSAKANDSYADGWQWEFDVTVWNLDETALKMKFDQWSGPGLISAGGNMQFSVNGTDWFDIGLSGEYPPISADVGAIDLSASLGRQLKIRVRMKVPAGTKAGAYNSSYGILTE